MATVLMIGEKPSIAQAIANILGGGGVKTRKGRSPGCSVHEFNGSFRGQKAYFKVTSVAGHVYARDFPSQYQNREQVKPIDLFTAPTIKVEANPKTKIVKHLGGELVSYQQKDSQYIVLWLDCDREGENICFEVIDIIKQTYHLDASMHPNQVIKSFNVLRAKFSAITASDIARAMATLTIPNYNEARAVDARQELDLKGKYGNLDSSVISYGPCQTPTLGFCVDRHDEIQSFTPESYWYITVVTEKGGTSVTLEWERGRIFDKEVASMFEKKVKAERGAKVIKITKKDGAKKRPTPLNTVNMLKLASTRLGMGPHQAMQIAERLYIQGYLSYPRTESTAYPSSYDLVEALQPFKSHPTWGSYVREMLDNKGITKPIQGHDAGDHPPITPMKSATEAELGGDWRLYDLVCRYFIGSVSPDCKYKKTTVTFSIADELFTCSGKMINPGDEGFTSIMTWLRPKTAGLPNFENNSTVPVISVSLIEDKTKPPGYLTESELISLMEKNGIGTDASIPVHIQNICERNYVQVNSNTRTLVPTPIGIALVHGYYKIDPEIVLPTVRSNIEKYMNYIAKGEATCEQVVEHALDVFVKKFNYFVENMSKMDELFEAIFSPIALTAVDSKLRSKCGICKRYMKFIPLKPCRLYCQTCEETYSLPQGGTIKLYQEHTCPLDNFELVLFSAGSGGKSYPICPFCYNNPENKEPVSCYTCTHPTCKHSMVRNGIMPHGEGCDGMMVFDPISGPKWKLECNKCSYAIFLPVGAHKISPTKTVCEYCGSVKLSIDFNKNNTPLQNGETLHVGCINCDEILYPLMSDGHIRQQLKVQRRSYRKGRKPGKHHKRK